MWYKEIAVIETSVSSIKVLLSTTETLAAGVQW
jgi:hypothetical protein